VQRNLHYTTGVFDHLLQVNSNGLISFGADVSGQYTPRSLPTSNPVSPLIAVYSADVNTTANNGRVHYRLIDGTDVHVCYSTKSTWIENCIFFLANQLLQQFAVILV